MYHIANDKRAKTSAAQIERGLHECIRTRQMSDICVTDLCKAAGVSRTTFYRLFDVPVDVLRWGCDRTYREMLDSQPYQDGSFDPKAAMHFMIGHIQALEAAVKCNRTDLIHDAIMNNKKPVMDLLLPSVKTDSLSEKQKAYAVNMFTGTLTSLLTTWISNGKKDSESELRTILPVYSSIIQTILRLVQ